MYKGIGCEIEQSTICISPHLSRILCVAQEKHTYLSARGAVLAEMLARIERAAVPMNLIRVIPA